jgi:hypothetical protein
MVRVSERVLQQWRDIEREPAEPAILLLFSSDLDPDKALGALRTALSGTIRELEQTLPAHPSGEEARTGAWSLAPSPDGVVLLIEAPDDFEAFLVATVRRLNELGVEGGFDVYSPQRFELPEKVDLIECRLRVAGARYHRRGRNYAWQPDNEALADVVAGATLWWRGNACAATLALATRTIPPTVLRPDDDVHAGLRRAIEQAAAVGIVRLISWSPRNFRSVVVEPSAGRVSLLEGGRRLADGDWQQPLASVSAVMRELAPSLAYGFAKRGSNRVAAELARSLRDDWPSAPQLEPNVLNAEPFEDEFAPDAFGLQLLGPGYSGWTPAGGSWRSEPAGTATIVAHDQPEEWFAAPFVEFHWPPRFPPTPAPAVPEVLARARTDFAAILYRDAARPEA